MKNKKKIKELEERIAQLEKDVRELNRRIFNYKYTPDAPVSIYTPGITPSTTPSITPLPSITWTCLAEVAK